MLGGGIRIRLAVTLVALVTVTVAGIGLGTYAFVDARLRDGLVSEISRQAQFDLSVLMPGRLGHDADLDAFEASGLPAAFRLRGDADFIVDFGDGNPYVSRSMLLTVPPALPAAIGETIASGHLGFAWLDRGSTRLLVVGGRAMDGPTLYLVVDDTRITTALDQLRLGLAAAGLSAIGVALALARLMARRILRPIRASNLVAARIALGDLAARVLVDGDDEFAAWAVEFNRMAEVLESLVGRLQASQEQNRRFVADVSHELRTPLAALVAETSIIEGGLGALAPDARRAAELLVADVRRLRLLIDDLLELSRFDADAEYPHLQPIDLSRLLRSTVATRMQDASLEVPDEPVSVESDVRRLDRIFGNLLDNARIHAMGAPVIVRLVRDDDRVTVKVMDRGPGVPDDALSHLFDRFYKTDLSRGAETSTSSGLGLAIAAENAALLGATIDVAARAGGGLVFTVTLPVSKRLRDGDGTDTDQVDHRFLSEPAPRIES